MDYYASWPSSKIPKWLGVMFGGIFTVIIAGCAWMIVDLTRPPRQHQAALAPPAAAAAAPQVAPQPVAPQPAAAAAVAADDADAAPTAGPAEKVAQVEKKATKKSASRLPARKPAVLAKHEAKSSRAPKNDSTGSSVCSSPSQQKTIQTSNLA